MLDMFAPFQFFESASARICAHYGPNASFDDAVGFGPTAPPSRVQINFCTPDLNRALRVSGTQQTISGQKKGAKIDNSL
jgi:hypothetical protein